MVLSSTAEKDSTLESSEFLGGFSGDSDLAFKARRALRALKGLVRLQALERKKWAKRFQAILRARAGRAQISELPHSHSSSQSSQIYQPGLDTPEKLEQGLRSRSKKLEPSSILWRYSSRSTGRIIGDYDRAHSERSWEQSGSAVKNGTREDEKTNRVLEIDSGKPHIAAKWRNLFQSSFGFKSIQP